MAPALFAFVVGVGFGLLTALLTYLAQLAFYENNENYKNWKCIIRPPRLFRFLALASGAAGFLAFATGAWKAIMALAAL
jgi:hypothetical protein